MAEFEWDYENIKHIARHGLSPEEVEYALTGPTMEVDFESDRGEDRLAEVGVTQRGRFILVWTTVRRDLLRVVTAYDAPNLLIQAYVER